MSSNTRLRAYLYASVAAGAMSVAATNAFAVCTGPGAPTTTQTKCLTAVTIPGNALNSFDISWVNPDRAEYYLGDRSNSGVDIIDTNTLTFKRTIGGFVGFTGNNNTSGPDGVVSHGRWLYAGDGNSTLKVIDLNAATPIQQTISTGGTTRVDEMALTTDGKLLLAANNAEDPPFATLFAANGDAATSNVTKILKISVDPTIIPAGAGLSLEQPAWDPKTARFYNSIPIIANNPAGCNYGQVVPAAPITCHGGLLAIDPTHPQAVYGAFDPGTHTGVIALQACSPNGASVGTGDNLMLGCTPGNNPSDTQTTIINAKTTNSVSVNGVTGSDEVWFNSGDRRYYLGASKDCTVPGGPCGAAAQQTPHLGVVDAVTKFLVEKIPSASNAHSVAADSDRNLIFLPENGNDTKGVAAGVCGNASNGCVAVYQHRVDHDDEGGNNQGDDNNHHDD